MGEKRFSLLLALRERSILERLSFVRITPLGSLNAKPFGLVSSFSFLLTSCVTLLLEPTSLGSFGSFGDNYVSKGRYRLRIRYPCLLIEIPKALFPIPGFGMFSILCGLQFRYLELWICDFQPFPQWRQLFYEKIRHILRAFSVPKKFVFQELTGRRPAIDLLVLTAATSSS